MSDFVTTLSDLRKKKACYDGYNKLVRSLQGKKFTVEDSNLNSYLRLNHTEEIPLTYILESNGFVDVLWTTRCLSGVDRDLRLYSVWCASNVVHLVDDQRIISALGIAEKFSNGEASSEELERSFCLAHASIDYFSDSDDIFRSLLIASLAIASTAENDAWKSSWISPVNVLQALELYSPYPIGATQCIFEHVFIQMCNGTAPWQIKNRNYVSI